MIRLWKQNNERGFVLYLSILLSGLAISVGLFMLNVTQREVLFSGYARAADNAFYAAETGAECALYWDLVGVNKRTAFPQVLSDGEAFLGQLICDPSWTEAEAGPGASAPVVTAATGPSGGGILGSATTAFDFNVMVNGQGYCASVVVTKVLSAAGGVFTSITSSGYSVDCASIGSSGTTDTDRFRRTVRLSY